MVGKFEDFKYMKYLKCDESVIDVIIISNDEFYIIRKNSYNIYYVYDIVYEFIFVWCCIKVK